MKNNLKGLMLSMSLLVVISGITQENSRENVQMQHSEFVVRWKGEQQRPIDLMPSGTTILSTHAPYNMTIVKNKSLGDQEMLDALRKTDGISYVSKVSTDTHFQSIYKTGIVLLEVKDNALEHGMEYCKNIGCTIERIFPALGWFAVMPSNTFTFESFNAIAKSSGLFANIMEDEIITASHHTSNDPYFASSWHIYQNFDADIDADIAWTSMPSNAVVNSVAVIDGHGFDTLHADMIGNWSDTYNAVDQTTDVYPISIYEKHATSCAGIIGAEYNNAIGVPGLGYNLLQVQAIKIGYNPSSSGSFNTSSLIQADAINHVIASSNTVAISMSFGSTTYQSTFYNAITNARTIGRNGKGIPVFASTGNNSSNVWTNYPASYSGVIAVGSSTSFDTRSSFSNYGPGLTFAAPGSAISTTDVTGLNGYSTSDYTNFSGTSAACPVAASVGAMMLVANPQLTETQVKQILAQTCEKVGGYTYTTSATDTYSTWSNELGYGRVNMNNAVLQSLQLLNTPPDINLGVTSVDDNTAIVGQLITINTSSVINLSNVASISPVLEYRWSSDQTWSSSDIAIGTDVSTLGAGISFESESITYVVPTGTGTRYILVRCDATNLVAESNENNNTVIIPITISNVISLPDVIVSNLTSDDITPNVGQTINISCIQSISNASSNASSIILEYRYSNDAVWSTTDILIGSDTSNIGITPMSSSESINYTIPTGAGNRYILVRADLDNGVNESNELNNTVVLTLAVANAVVSPDVTISSLTPSASNVVEGQNVTVNFQQIISNPPSSPVSVTLEYRWSSDVTWSTSDFLLGTGSSTLGGNVSAESEIFSFNIPVGLGNYFLLVKADAGNVILETNESNIYSTPFTVSTPSTLPDIVMSAIVVSTNTVTVGQLLTVNSNQNINLSSYSLVNSYMEYRWATTSTFSTAYPIVGVDFSSLGAGDAFDDETHTFTVPAGTGTRYLMIKCDSNNGISETNESNNVYAIAITVMPAPVINTHHVNDDGTAEVNSDYLNEAIATDDLVSELVIKTFPNPARNMITILLNNNEEGVYYELRDLQGSLTLQGQIQREVTSETIDLSNVSGGIYFMLVKTDHEVFTDKIMVVH